MNIGARSQKIGEAGQCYFAFFVACTTREESARAYVKQRQWRIIELNQAEPGDVGEEVELPPS